MNTLVLCLDGTSNRYRRDSTNVMKLAAMLDKRATNQLLYYQPGIGTLVPPGVLGGVREWLLTRLDLALGTLLKYHVQDAYRFLMRFYEEGDEIFIFGFSRGAYTARVLTGLLCKVGLLARGNEGLLPFAWDEYAVGRHEIASGLMATFSRPVSVEFLGVWDTVSSVRYVGDERHFAYTFDNPIVRCVRHAVSLDERRTYFRQNLWMEPARSGQDIRQVWFPGVHCDVGGGYAESESGLSKIALKWMLDELGSRLAFDPVAVSEVLPEVASARFSPPTAMALMHNSLRGLWHIVELIPRRVDIRQPDGSFARRWIIPRGRPRWVAAGAEMHPSVYERIRLDPSYRPTNLPAVEKATQAVATPLVSRTHRG